MKTVKTEIYVAHDGTKFFYKEECRNYEEKRIQETKRARWVEQKYSDFLNYRSKGKTIHTVDKFTIVGNFSIYCNRNDGHVVIANLRNGRSGKAVCSNPKYFDDKIGIAVAWARYLNEEVPVYI